MRGSHSTDLILILYWEPRRTSVQKIQKLAIFGQNNEALYTKAEVRFISASDFTSPYMLYFQVQRYQALKIAEDVRTSRGRAKLLRYTHCALLSV